MNRLFLAPEQFDITRGTARITGQDHVHLTRVLRTRIGDRIALLDGAGAAYIAILARVDGRESLAEIGGPLGLPPEQRPRIHVGQALGKGDKFEQVVQHGTEAGAATFTPIATDRSVPEIPPERLPVRLERWRAIAKGAAEQSGRSIVPGVRAPAPLADVVREARGTGGLVLMLHSGEAAALRATLNRAVAAPDELTVLVGPEGGWTARELADAGAHGCEIVSLGPHVLRTETAALVAVSQVRYHFAGSDSMRQI